MIGRWPASFLALGALAVLSLGIAAQARVADGRPAGDPRERIWLAATSLSASGIIISNFAGETRIVGEGTWYGMPRWSPDGQVLAAVVDTQGQHKVVLVDPASGMQRTILEDAGFVAGMAWSSDGLLGVKIQGGSSNGLMVLDREGS